MLDISKMTAKELAELARQREQEEQDERKRSRQQYEERQFALVESIAGEAFALNKQMQELRASWEKKIADFTEFLRTYSHRTEDWKGNIQLIDEDQLVKVEYCNKQTGHYDARGNEGAQLVLDFINEQLKDNEQILKLVKSLLEPKSGKFDTYNILKLLKMEDDYTDQRWKRGLQLLKESYTPTGQKSYFRFYKRERPDAEWVAVPLNIANT